MSFCSICGSEHDSRFPCIDKTGQILDEMGLGRHAQLPPKNFLNWLNRRILSFL
jgi:hypothetical protein